jgi:hypothetical protein
VTQGNASMKQVEQTDFQDITGKVSHMRQCNAHDAVQRLWSRATRMEQCNTRMEQCNAYGAVQRE